MSPPTNFNLGLSSLNAKIIDEQMRVELKSGVIPDTVLARNHDNLYSLEVFGSE